MKKAKGKLKMDYGMLSLPYFGTPVSRNDEGFLEIIPSRGCGFKFLGIIWNPKATLAT